MLCRLCMHAFAARQLAALRGQQQAGWKAAGGSLSSPLRKTSRTYATPSDSETQTTGVLSRRLDVLAGRASRVQQVRVAPDCSAAQGRGLSRFLFWLATGHRLSGKEGETARHGQRSQHGRSGRPTDTAAAPRAQTWSKGRRQLTSGRRLPTRRKCCRRACRACACVLRCQRVAEARLRR